MKAYTGSALLRGWRPGVDPRLRRGGVGKTQIARGERTSGTGAGRPADRVCPRTGVGHRYSSLSEVTTSSEGSALAVETTKSSTHPHMRRRSKSQESGIDLTASPRCSMS
jgi:hypothetical protein